MGEQIIATGSQGQQIRLEEDGKISLQYPKSMGDPSLIYEYDSEAEFLSDLDMYLEFRSLLTVVVV